MTPAERASKSVRGRAGGYLAGADLTRSVEAAIRAAVAAETERCAGVARHATDTFGPDATPRDAAEQIAAAIRGGQDAG